MSPRTTAATRSGTTIRSARRRWPTRTPPHEGSDHESKRPALNYIVVNRKPHDRKLPRTQRETRADMLPHELALAEWKNNATTANLELLASTPVMLGGKPAARVTSATATSAGGRAGAGQLGRRPDRLSLLYEAQAIVYFPRGLADFESLLASVRFQHK